MVGRCGAETWRRIFRVGTCWECLTTSVMRGRKYCFFYNFYVFFILCIFCFIIIIYFFKLFFGNIISFMESV